jgi:hypothetical protein
LDGKKADVLFIDGDHTYAGVKKDFAMYSPFVKDDGIIIFHDILENANDPDCQVDKFWQELVQKKISREFINSESQGWAGIGIIFNRIPERKIYERYNLVSMQIPGNELIRPMYEDNIRLFSYAFDDLGIEYTYSDNELRKGYNNIIFLSHSNPDLNNYLLDFTYLPFQLEQLPLTGKSKHSYARFLKGAVFILDYSQQNIKYLNSENFNNVLYLPFGFHPNLQVLDPEKEKTIEILFYGELNPYRVKVLNELSGRGYRVIALQSVYGKERNSYLEQAKIILNIHRFPGCLLEEQRLSFLLNNKCFVISEAIAENQVNPYGDGIVLADYDKLVETCEFYLKPENNYLREVIAEKGFRNFSAVNMTTLLKNITEQIRIIL